MKYNPSGGQNVDPSFNGYVKLVCAMIANYFRKTPDDPYTQYRTYCDRIEYAKHDTLIDMFCDCTDNFHPDRLRSEIIKRQEHFISLLPNHIKELPRRQPRQLTLSL